jgi:hypothetical protein
MKKPMKLCNRVAMLAKTRQPKSRLKVTLLWSLLGCSGALLAADTEIPDVEFIEYLGLWEESDADWLLFSEEVREHIVADETRTEPAPEGKDSAESNDES